MLKYIVLIVFLIQCCFAEVVVNNIDDLKHYVISLDLKLNIANHHYNSQNKTEWFANDRYKDTFFNVIPNAIADCITQRGVFAKEKLDSNMVVFSGTDTELYTAKNWNAVVFYNYIKKLYDTIISNDSKKKVSNDDIYKQLNKDLIKIYANNEKEIKRACYEIQEYYDKFILFKYKLSLYIKDFEKDNRNWIGYQTFSRINQKSSGMIDASIYLKRDNPVLHENVFNLKKNILKKNIAFSFTIQNGKVSNLIKYSTKESDDEKYLEMTKILLNDYMKPVKSLDITKIKINKDSKENYYSSSFSMFLLYVVRTPIVQLKLDNNEVSYECANLRKYFSEKHISTKANISFQMINELAERMSRHEVINKVIHQDLIYNIATHIINALIDQYKDYKFLMRIILGINAFAQGTLDLSKIPVLPNDDADGDSDSDDE